MAIINNQNKQGANYINHIIKPYKREYREKGLLGKLAGPQSSAIWGKILPREAGEKIVYSQLQNYLTQPKFGAAYNARLIGDGIENLKLGTDDVKIEPFRFDSKLINRRHITQMSGYDFWREVRWDLMTTGEKLNDYRIISALSRAFTGNGDDNDGTGLIDIQPNTDLQNRIKAGTFVGTTVATLSPDRFMFGSMGASAGDTVGLRALAMHVTDDLKEANKLSAAMLYDMSVLASEGSRSEVNGEYENSIEPHDFSTHAGYTDKRYILLTTELQFSNLLKDPMWLAQAQRGVIESATFQPSVLFNTAYKGTLFGISVIVDKNMNRLSWTTAAVQNTNVASKVGYSVLLGAGAIANAIGGEPELIEDSDDYDNVRGICHSEISGMKVLKFPSKKVDVVNRGKNFYPHVENGLIHVFTTA